MYVCMYVCLSVTGLRLKYTSLRIVYVPSGTCPSWFAKLTQSSRYDGRLRGETTTPGQRTRPEVQKTCDERRQYDSERRRLARQQQSESLRSLTARERDTGKEQHGIVVGRLHNKGELA